MHKKPENHRRFKANSIFNIALVLVATLIAASLACSSEPDTIIHTVVVEKEVPVQGKTVIQTVVVEKEVEVPVEKIVVEEVVVMGETVVQTVVVEREVVVEAMQGEAAATARPASAPAATAAPASAGAPEPDVVREVTVVVEMEVEKVVEKEVVREVEVAPAATAAPASAGQPASAQPASPSQPSQPGATQFQNTTRSEFALTAEDDTSTFSLDTDRTSFQLALNWARAGYEVDPASVRAEEWINAFNYGYEQPRHDDSFNIQTDIIEHPLENGLYLARVAFQAPEISVDLPLNVTLVLDGSGSMADDNRVAIAREAAEAIRNSLGRDDRISIVHFDNQVKHRLTVEDEDPGHVSVRESIDNLTPDGGTNVQDGLNLGVRLTDEMRRRRPEALNYIILMSDGVANVNATDPFAILESAADHNPDNPLRLITIGVGIHNYNDVLLEQLAQHGNGWYRYLSEPYEGQVLFSRDNWLALSVPFADQTRAQVVWNEQIVRSWRMIGYENRVTSDESFTRAEKKFAELPAGAATTVFFELELVDPSLWDQNDQSLGDVEVRWVTPRTGDDNRQHHEIDADLVSPDAAAEFGSIVALAADRYSGLHEYGGEHPGTIHNNLSDLINQLMYVGPPIMQTDAFRDFEFVLKSLIDSVEPLPSTGYSR